jgi:predicted ATPase
LESFKFIQYIRRIELCKESIESFSTYPFCLDAVKNLSTIELHPKVTYIIGENGTGKSTILEAIATSFGFNPEGGTQNFNFSTMSTHSNLYKYIKLIKGVKRLKDGFFSEQKVFIILQQI